MRTLAGKADDATEHDAEANTAEDNLSQHSDEEDVRLITNLGFATMVKFSEYRERIGSPKSVQDQGH